MSEPMFYLENKERGCVGNSVQWWKVGDNGYTCDIRKAKKFSEEKAREIVREGEKFRMHQVESVDRIVQHHIDIQDLRSGALVPHTMRQP